MTIFDHLLTASALVVYVLSLGALLLRGRKHGLLAFVYLFWLHAIVGAGYVFLLPYRHWNLGERDPGWEYVELGWIAGVYVLLICLALAAATWMLLRKPLVERPQITVPCAKVTAVDVGILATFLTLHVLGIFFGTLRIGTGVIYALPFQLNGVIEVTTYFLLPFWSSYFLWRRRTSFLTNLVLVALYAMLNLYFFGSKYAAIFPIITVVTIRMALDRHILSKACIAGLTVAALYVLINPFYFRTLLREEQSVGFVNALKESGENSAYAAGRSTNGLRNLCLRITGVMPMQEAIDDIRRTYGNPILPVTLTHPWCHYNQSIRPTDVGTSCATGYFAWFMILLGSHVSGFVVALLLQIPLAKLFFVIDARCRDEYSLDALVPIAFLLMLLPLLVGGAFDWLGRYLQIGFAVIVSAGIVAYQKRTIAARESVHFAGHRPRGINLERIRT